jgi:hypothetical protein
LVPADVAPFGSKGPIFVELLPEPLPFVVVVVALLPELPGRVIILPNPLLAPALVVAFGGYLGIRVVPPEEPLSVTACVRLATQTQIATQAKLATQVKIAACVKITACAEVIFGVTFAVKVLVHINKIQSFSEVHKS